MDIKSGDLGDDIRDLVLEIVKTLPIELQTNETASDIWVVLTKHIQTLNLDVIHDQREVDNIPDLERYTEYKVANSLTKSILETPVLYESMSFDEEHLRIPNIRRRFTLPVFRIKK